MADDEAQGQEDTAWWAFDAFADSSLPSASFDEPLLWPEPGNWEQPPAGGPGDAPLAELDVPNDLDGGPLFPPASDSSVVEQPPFPDLVVQWSATESDADAIEHQSRPLAGLGGGADNAAPFASGPPVELLPESIWTDAPTTGGDIGLISTTGAPAAPSVYPTAERSPEGSRWRRFDFRQGNTAVVGLISVVSLVLLGMFLSVRARNDLPADSPQSRRPSNEISATGAATTVPPTTTTTATPGIRIADLLPATDAGAAPAGGTTASEGASGSSSPAAIAAPSRGTGSSGGEGSTPAASSPTPTSPPATSPPVQDTTPPDTAPLVDTTVQRRTTTSFTLPPFPTTQVPTKNFPSYTIPTWANTAN